MLADLGHTVTAVHVTTTRDTRGNTTETTTETVCPDVLFAPEGMAESVRSDTAPLIGEATLYGKFPVLDADDTVSHAASCCDGADFAHGSWQVEGGARGWGRGDRAVPIRRTAQV